MPKFNIILNSGTTKNVEFSGLTSNFNPIYFKLKPTTTTTTTISDFNSATLVAGYSDEYVPMYGYSDFITNSSLNPTLIVGGEQITMIVYIVEIGALMVGSMESPNYYVSEIIIDGTTYNIYDGVSDFTKNPFIIGQSYDIVLTEIDITTTTTTTAQPIYVCGAGTENSNGVYYYYESTNGKNTYTKDEFVIFWLRSSGIDCWVIRQGSSPYLYYSDEDVLTPDLVETWKIGTVGYPLVYDFIGDLPLPYVTATPCITTTTSTTVEQTNIQPIVMSFNITSSGETLILPLVDDSSLTYNFDINWGDDTIETITGATASHIYNTSGIKTVTIQGQMEGWQFASDDQATKLLTISGGNGHIFKYLCGDYYGAFDGCDNLTTFDCPNWDISQVNSLEYLFYSNTSLTTCNVTNWDTSNVTTFNSTFSYCEKLSSIDITNWNTSLVNNMSTMFYRCYDLINLDVTNFDTSNVNDMSGMFSYDSSLISITGINNWITTNVTTMSNFVINCSALTTFMPSSVFWENLGTGSTSVTTTSSCFTNATNISNYASIPASWGGGGA